jgi:phycobilisome core component
MDRLKAYFQSGTARISAAGIINANSSTIVRKAGAQLFEEVPELIRPSGNAYTTRRFSACLRDMDYYLRYASYALVAGDNHLLDERVLQGLRETYNSLGVPIGPTVRGIQIMKDMVKSLAAEAGVDDTSFIDEPFDHLSRELSDISV